MLLSRLGIGSMEDVAWTALKQYKKGSKEIVELAGEVEKLARRLHPRDEEAAEWQAMDTFLGASERPLAAEVRKLGCHTLESTVTTTRRIEKILAEQADPEKELRMQEQIRLLQEGLVGARKQIAQPPTTSTANSAIQPPPLTPTQPPPPARHAYQDYTEENPHYSPPHRPRGQKSPQCFLCGEEGHLAANCPARSALQRLLRQQTPVRLLEGSSEAKVAQVGCMVGPPITGPLTLEGIPVLGLVDTGASVTCLGFDVWWRYRAQWEPLKPFEGRDTRCTRQTTPNCW